MGVREDNLYVSMQSCCLCSYLFYHATVVRSENQCRSALIVGGESGSSGKCGSGKNGTGQRPLSSLPAWPVNLLVYQAVQARSNKTRD